MKILNASVKPHEKAKELTHGYWQIPAKVAKQLCGGTLPQHGHERKIQYNGQEYWISNIPDSQFEDGQLVRRMVWAMKAARIICENERGIHFTFER